MNGITSLASNGNEIGLQGRPRRQQPTPDETPVFAHTYRKINSYQDLMSSRIIVIDDDEAIRLEDMKEGFERDCKH